jgi:hypothetical protein
MSIHIDSPLSRAQIAHRLDALLARDGAAGPWPSVAPPGVIYKGTHDAGGFTLRREQTPDAAVMKWSAVYEDCDGGTRIVLRNANGLRSVLIWMFAGFVLPMMILALALSGFAVDVLIPLTIGCLIIGIAMTALLHVVVGRDEKVDRDVLERLLTISEAEAYESAGQTTFDNHVALAAFRGRHDVGTVTIHTRLSPEEIDRRIAVLIDGNRIYTPAGFSIKPQYAGTHASGEFRIVQRRRIPVRIQVAGTITRSDDRSEVAIRCFAESWSVVELMLVIVGACWFTFMLFGIIQIFGRQNLAIMIGVAVVLVAIYALYRPSSLKGRAAREYQFLKRVLDPASPSP